MTPNPKKLQKDLLVVYYDSNSWHKEYQKYLLESPGWRYTKFWRKDCKCECGARARLELHHESYRWHNAHPILRWFFPNMVDEMRTLCNFCHGLEHE